jgi:MerR family transcriptional regulator, light-induced transcriptional regulator
LDSSKSVIASSLAVSPRQAASALGVSESSVKRWCDQGRLEVVKTPGGHRRLPVTSLVRFAREEGHPLHDPMALALKEPAHQHALGAVRAELLDALLGDDGNGVHRVLEAEWLGGRGMDGLCDAVITPTLSDLGERWRKGRVAIYQERRAGELLQRALLRLGEALAPRGAERAHPERVLALGGALEGDPYELPTLMAELVLRERGFDARSLGTGLPAETIVRAIAERRPRLVWVAAAVASDEARFALDFSQIADAASAVGAAVAVGGRALHRSLRQQLRYSTFCDAMAHLAAFADAFMPVRGAAEPGAHSRARRA